MDNFTLEKANCWLFLFLQHVHYTYKADETGYHVNGSHVPVAPPVPTLIARSLEYQRLHATQAPEV